MKTFTIELRVSYDTVEQDEIIKNAARQAAKHLYATAILLSDKRKPQIALYTSDFIEGAAELELADDMPDDVGHEVAGEEKIDLGNDLHAKEIGLTDTELTEIDLADMPVKGVTASYTSYENLEDKEDEA